MTKREFIKLAKESIGHAVDACNEYLSRLDLSLSVNFEYDFNEFDSSAIGVYEAGSVFEGTISVSYNANALFETFKEEMKCFPWSSEENILDELAETTIYHEMGHGICELFNDYLEYSDDLDELYDNNKELFDRTLDNEEDSVEQFAYDFYDGSLDGNDVAEMVQLYLNAF